MASVSNNGAIAAPSTTIQTIPAKSSWIAAFEYDPTQMRLTTHLKSGDIYQHTFVTGLDWMSLQTAPNHAKHWAQNIKSKKLAIHVKSAKAPKSESRKKEKRS